MKDSWEQTQFKHLLCELNINRINLSLFGKELCLVFNFSERTVNTV